MIRTLKDAVRRVQFELALPRPARAERANDHKGIPVVDPGPEQCIVSNLNWLRKAQDCSPTGDGGFAWGYNLLKAKWASSYPETTGYIIPTLLSCAREFNDLDLRKRAARALDWCVSIQMPCGGFQGGMIDSEPVVPVTFNTGQILIGLAAGVAEFGRIYRAPLRAASDWLVDTLDADCCWRRYPTPFAEPGEKSYEVHVSWGLFEADRVDPGRGYGDAGLRQVLWALRYQRPNGWFEKCCLSDPSQPLTHTIGYVLRGIIEAYRWSREPRFLQAALRTSERLVALVNSSGYLAGNFNSEWHPTVRSSCLTGSAQIAACFFQLYSMTGRRDFVEAGRRLCGFVRRTVHVDGPEGVKGGVKGSFPVDGAYASFAFLNWAVKFLIDANLMELEVQSHAQTDAAIGSLC